MRSTRIEQVHVRLIQGSDSVRPNVSGAQFRRRLPRIAVGSSGDGAESLRERIKAKGEYSTRLGRSRTASERTICKSAQLLKSDESPISDRTYRKLGEGSLEGHGGRRPAAAAKNGSEIKVSGGHKN